MKLIKIFALLLILVLTLSMLACDKGSGNEDYLVCPQCFSKCDTGSSFCNQCGSSLKDAQLMTSGDKGSDDDEIDYDNVDCFECFDNGYDTCQGHSCTMCGGKGSKNCYGCNGSGIFGGMSCFGCDGSGLIPCFSCNSTGTVYHKYTQLPDSVPTSTNPHKSTEKCDKCQSGKINCTLCNGTGHFGTGEVPSYGGSNGGTYEKLCSLCHGAKTRECPYCGGDGIKGN